MKSNDLSVITILSSVVSRVNLISSCLPDKLQMYMEDAKINIIKYLKSIKCEIKFDSTKKKYFLDKVSLFIELNSIISDLSISLLLISNNFLLEDALYNIDYVIRNMAEYDSVFRACYFNGKLRVLK